MNRFEEGNISYSTTITFWKTLWSVHCRCSENKGFSNFPFFSNWQTENKMPHWLPLLPKIHLRDLSKAIVWIQQANYFLLDHLQFVQCTNYIIFNSNKFYLELPKYLTRWVHVLSKELQFFFNVLNFGTALHEHWSCKLLHPSEPMQLHVQLYRSIWIADIGFI